MDTIIFVFTMIVIFSSLLYLEMIRKRIAFGKYVDEAAKRSAFSPTEFHIYDKSTEKRCDRLIVVYPFEWHIWAIANQLYILNPEGGIICGAGSTPAVKVVRDQFFEVCLKIDYDSLLRGYTEGVTPSKIVPYEINSSTFTVLSALNLLVKGWVTFDQSIQPMPAYVMKTIDDDEEEGGGNHRRRCKREISGQTVERLTSRNRTAHAQLLEQYRFHVRGRDKESTA